MDLRPEANSLADKIEAIKVFFATSGVGRHELMGGISPIFNNGIRSEIGATSNSAPWTVGDLLDTLSYLESYFRDHPTTLGMHMTVSSDDGRRAYMKVEKPPTEHFNEQFNTRGSVTADSDRLDVWFYTDEVVDQVQYDGMMQHFRAKIDSGSPTSKVQRGITTKLEGPEYAIAFSTPSPSGSSTRLTWRQLSDAVTFVNTLVSERVHRKTVFQGKIMDKDGLVRGRIDIRLVSTGDTQTVTAVV